MTPIGEPRHRLVIEAPVETPDGAGGVARTFSTLATVWAAIEPGDVLLFRWRAHLPAKHAAILVESDRMVHAHDGAAVAEVYYAGFWRRRLAFAYHYPGIDDRDSPVS